jgi:ferredoxin, 2Fe-2S
MHTDKKAIHFAVNYDEAEYELQTYEYEYRNLMVLLSEKIYIDDFGECRGMGRCGTCAVEIKGLPDELTNRERNEEQTLSKMGICEGNIRLSCQLLVDSNLENITVEIIAV